MMDDGEELFNLEGIGVEPVEKKSQSHDKHDVQDDFVLQDEDIFQPESEHDTSLNTHIDGPFDEPLDFDLPGGDAYPTKDRSEATHEHPVNGFTLVEEGEEERQVHDEYNDAGHDAGPELDAGSEQQGFVDDGSFEEGTAYQDDVSAYDRPKKSSSKTLLLAGVTAIAVIGMFGTFAYKKHEAHEHRHVIPLADTRNENITMPSSASSTSLPMSDAPQGGISNALPKINSLAQSSLPATETSDSLITKQASTPNSSVNVKSDAINPTTKSESDLSSHVSNVAPNNNSASASSPNTSTLSSSVELPNTLSPVKPIVPQGVETPNGKAPPIPSAVADMMASKANIPAGAVSRSGIKETPLPTLSSPPPSQSAGSNAAVPAADALSAAQDLNLDQKTAYMRGLINLMQNEIITLHTEIGTMQKQQEGMQTSIAKNRSDMDQSLAVMNTSISAMTKAQSDGFAKLEKMVKDKKEAANVSDFDPNQILTEYRLVAVSKTKDEVERLSDKRHFIIEVGHDIPGAGTAQKTIPYMKSTPDGDVQSWELITTRGRIVP